MDPKYFTFEEIPATHHPNMPGAVQKLIYFPNRHGISFVGGGSGLYGDGKTTWEACVISHNLWYYRDFKWPFDQVNIAGADFSLDDEPNGYLSIADCDKLIKEVRNRPDRVGLDIIKN